MALVAPTYEIVLDVLHEPPPPGLQEVKIVRKPNEKLGLSIQGGAGSPVGPPLDLSDEGVFVSKITPDGAVARDGKLMVGMRILEVNGKSLLQATHEGAVELLRAAVDDLQVLVCLGPAVLMDMPSPLQSPLLSSQSASPHLSLGTQVSQASPASSAPSKVSSRVQSEASSRVQSPLTDKRPLLPAADDSVPASLSATQPSLPLATDSRNSALQSSSLPPVAHTSLDGTTAPVSKLTLPPVKKAPPPIASKPRLSGSTSITPTMTRATIVTSPEATSASYRQTTSLKAANDRKNFFENDATTQSTVGVSPPGTEQQPQWQRQDNKMRSLDSDLPLSPPSAVSSDQRSNGSLQQPPGVV